MFRYAAGEPLAHEDDATVKMAVDFVKGRIDDSIEKYQHSVELGRTGGRPKKNDDEIRRLAAQGLSASEIGELVGRSKETIRKKDAFKMGQAEYMAAKAKGVKELGF